MTTAAVRTGTDVAEEQPERDFAEFFHATWPRVFRTVYGVAGDVATAEDALQSAYAKAFTSWRRVRAASHPEAYVRRMAVNEVLGIRRRPFHRRETLVATHPERSTPEDLTSLDRDSVWRAVLALPPRQRAVIVLRYYEGLSEAEIAEVLQCSRGTVKSQASDALRRLRADVTTGDLT